MNYLDLGALAILFISTVLGFHQGFVRSALPIAAFIVSAIAGYYFGYYLEAYLMDLLSNPEVRQAVAMVLVFILCYLVLFLVIRSLQEIMSAGPMGYINRVLGALFGVARGGAILLLCLVLAKVVSANETPAWEDSRAVAVLESFESTVRDYFHEAEANGEIPGSLEEGEKILEENLKQLGLPTDPSAPGNESGN